MCKHSGPPGPPGSPFPGPQSMVSTCASAPEGRGWARGLSWHLGSERELQGEGRLRPRRARRGYVGKGQAWPKIGLQDLPAIQGSWNLDSGDPRQLGPAKCG